MNNSILHLGLQIIEKDYDNFYCDVLGFDLNRSFELTDENAEKIFQKQKGTTVLVGKIPELKLELFISHDVLSKSFNHVCFETDRIPYIKSSADKYGYRTAFLDHSGTLFLSDSCNNLFEIKPLSR